MCAAAAHAGTWTFGLNGDGALPIGDFGKVPDSNSNKPEIGQKLGFGGGAFADYWIKDNYAFGVDVNGQFFSAKSDFKDLLNSQPGVSDANVKTNVISVGAHGVWAPGMKDAPAQPWVTYGVGLYHVAGKIEGVGISPTDGSVSKVGFNFGAGADMKAGASMKVGAHVRYHYVMDGLGPKMFDFPETAFDKGAMSYLTFGINLTFMTTGAK